MAIGWQRDRICSRCCLLAAAAITPATSSLSPLPVALLLPVLCCSVTGLTSLQSLLLGYNSMTEVRSGLASRGIRPAGQLGG